jgi:hypothetical protein
MLLLYNFLCFAGGTFMKLKFVFFLFFITLFCLNTFSIQVKIDKSEAQFIEENNFQEPYVFLGHDLIFKGKSEDLFAFNRSINFTGETKFSLITFGENIILNGKIGHNLITGGKEVEINNEINGTVFLTGDNITIQKNTVINGAVFVVSRNIKILGKINGDVFIGSGRIILDGIINGNVKVGTGRIILNDNAKINGNMEYSSEWELSKTEKSKISGNLNFIKKISNFKNEMVFNDNNEIVVGIKKAFQIFFIIFTLFNLIAFLIGGLILLSLPIMKNIETPRTIKNFWISGLFGLIPFVIYPAVVLILLVIFPLSFIFLLAGLPILFLTQVIGVTMFGQFLFKIFKWEKINRHLYFLFGIIFYSILSFIPGICFLNWIFFSCLGWGLILEGLFNRKLT